MKHMIDDSVSRIKHFEDNSYHNYNRNEVRCIGDHLHRFLEKKFVFYVIQAQCKDDWKRKPRQQAVNAQNNGIAHDPPEIIRVEESDEVFQTDPLAPPDSFCHYVVLKSDLAPYIGIYLKIMM